MNIDELSLKIITVLMCLQKEMVCFSSYAVLVSFTDRVSTPDTDRSSALFLRFWMLHSAMLPGTEYVTLPISTRRRHCTVVPFITHFQGSSLSRSIHVTDHA